MGARVLVTRPEPGASRTAETLSELGFQPVLLPLTRIDPVDCASLTGGDLDAVAITSVNAVRHSTEEILAPLLTLPCFVVGAETEAAARDAAFTSIIRGSGDADGLADAVIERMPAGTRVAYLCGRLRRPSFEEILSKAGMLVTAVETYATRSIDYTPSQLRSDIGREPLDFALLYSLEAALALTRLMHDTADPAQFKATRFVCLSRRIAAILTGSNRVTTIAAEPTEASLLSRLRDISSGES